MIGQVEAAAGRDEQAVVMLRRAVTLDAGLLDARYALSRALLRLGRAEEAQQELRAFEQARPRRWTSSAVSSETTSRRSTKC